MSRKILTQPLSIYDEYTFVYWCPTRRSITRKSYKNTNTERFHPVLTRGLQRHLYSDIIMAIINSILAVTTDWWKKWIKPRSGVFVKDLLTWCCQFQLTFILADSSKVKATRKMPMTRQLLFPKVQKRQVWEEEEEGEGWMLIKRRRLYKDTFHSSNDHLQTFTLTHLRVM